jgi:peptidoglycan hydrolase CwlO-like protein
MRIGLSFNLLCLSVAVLVTPSLVKAIDCSGTPPSDANQLIDYIENCNQKINQSKDQQQTLNSAIIVLNSKVNLAQGQINQTQDQIDDLEQDIKLLSSLLLDLNQSLNDLSITYAARVRESYKQKDLNLIRLFFSSDSFGQLLTKVRYFSSIKARDRALLEELEKTRLDYDNQKLTKETKQEEIEVLKSQLVGQKFALGGQKQSKQDLLTITKNDEDRYQELLAKAQAELAAIAAIIAGRGEEEKVGDVNEGDKIATVLTSGPNLYACSSGPHLHFEVAQNSAHKNPFEFLSNQSLQWDNADSPQNGSGSWSWPLSNPIRVTQGYGATSYSSIYAGGIHTGIDIVNTENYNVKTVKKGTLYRGGISCRGGTLQYVHVDHADDDYDTYYLHVNYF